MAVDAFAGVGTGRGTTRGVVPVPQSSSPPFSMIVATRRRASSSVEPSPEDDGVESSSGRLVGRAATVVAPPTLPPPTTMVDGLSSPLILDNYDTFLLDMWGVMHDGRAPYEGVLRAVRKLKESGKRLIVLSNSSKRREDAERMLAELGFDPADFHDIVTSGDVSHRLLRGDAGGGVVTCENWDAIDDVIARRGAGGRKNVFVFGSGDDDGGYCESAGWTPSPVEDADLLLARGTFTIDDGSGTVIHKGDDEALYWEVMERSMMVASRRRLPMLVSNPDKVRPDAGSKTPMPGAIGDAYERFVWTTNCNPVGDMTEEGARSYVRRIGKPFGEVYDIALSSVSSSMSSSSSSSDDDDEDGRRRDRVIMIGDALETDVVGGDNAGIDVLWVVNDGIHGADVCADGMGGVDGALGRFNRNNEHTYAYGRVVAPRYAADHFRW